MEQAQATESTGNAEDNYRGVWGNRIGFGNKAAMILVDFVKAYTLDHSPLYGPMVVEASKKTAVLLETARACGVSVIHTHVGYEPSGLMDAGMWIRKAPVLACLTDPLLGEFNDEVRPIRGEVVVTKQYASAFFGTSLAAMLTAAGIDTIVVTGCSTSGCVRATAVDGIQNGFRVVVPRECVGDRHIDPHRANLFDIDSKYGDVVDMSEVSAYFERYRGPRA